MSSSPRLQGLKLLRFVGAPVPDWQVAEHLDDISCLRLPVAEFGWTIRACRRDGERERGLFYLNNADPDIVRQVLRHRFTSIVQNEFYIVYPSWKFRFSCNIVLRNQTYCVEGKYGSQKDLSVGKSMPDFGLLIPFAMLSQMKCYVESPNEEVRSWLGRILYWCKHIPRESFYTEVALTDKPALVFYELFVLQEKRPSSLFSS